MRKGQAWKCVSLGSVACMASPYSFISWERASESVVGVTFCKKVKSPLRRAELKPGMRAYGLHAASQPELWRERDASFEPSQLISADSYTNVNPTGQKLEI